MIVLPLHVPNFSGTFKKLAASCAAYLSDKGLKVEHFTLKRTEGIQWSPIFLGEFTSEYHNG
jgi:hypothetical protein